MQKRGGDNYMNKGTTGTGMNKGNTTANTGMNKGNTNTGMSHGNTATMTAQQTNTGKLPYNWQESLWNWDPFREMSMLKENMNEMLSNLLGYTYQSPNYYTNTMYPTGTGMYSTSGYPTTGGMYPSTGMGMNTQGTTGYMPTTTQGSTGYTPSTTTTSRMMSGWMPQMDIYQDKNSNLVYETSLPGMKKEDITINVTDNYMTISGETKTNEEVKEGNYYYRESRSGKFTRTVPLPENTTSDKVKAEYKNGILKITMPMNKSEKAKKIKVD